MSAVAGPLLVNIEHPRGGGRVPNAKLFILHPRPSKAPIIISNKTQQIEPQQRSGCSLHSAKQKGGGRLALLGVSQNWGVAESCRILGFGESISKVGLGFWVSPNQGTLNVFWAGLGFESAR